MRKAATLYYYNQPSYKCECHLKWLQVFGFPYFSFFFPFLAEICTFLHGNFTCLAKGNTPIIINFVFFICNHNRPELVEIHFCWLSIIYMFSFLIKICLVRIYVEKNLNCFLFVTLVGYFLFMFRMAYGLLGYYMSLHCISISSLFPCCYLHSSRTSLSVITCL